MQPSFCLKGSVEMKKSLKHLIFRVLGLFKNVIMFLPRFFYKIQTHKYVDEAFPVIDFTGLDHFPHKNSCIEWWYFTGILKTPSKKDPIGFHITFFRIRTLFDGRAMHVSITDPNNDEFHNKALHMVLYPKCFDTQDTDHVISIFKNNLFYDKKEDAFLLKADMGEIKMDLKMGQGSLMPLGTNGVIDAAYLNSGSYYYSVPDLRTEGTLVFDGNPYDVSGMTWYDHQWGNFPLTNIAWQWFSLRLNEKNLYIMIFHFTDAGRDRCFGNIRCGAGAAEMTDIQIKPIEFFELRNGRTCPIAWNLQMKIGEGVMIFHIKALVKNQFIQSVITPSFWEGMCSAEGEVASDILLNEIRLIKGEKMHGSAYVEITGLE